MWRLYSLECTVLVPLILPALTLAVPPFARAFVLLDELSILVVLETPLARLLYLSSMEVFTELLVKGVEEVAHLIR